MQLWDTAGEERFKALTPMYYRTAECILLAFSLTSAESYENLERWMKDVDNNATTANYIKIIVGLKCDLD